MPFVKQQPRIPNETQVSTIFQKTDIGFNDGSSNGNVLDLNNMNVEVLQKIQRFTQDANEMMR